MQVEVLLNVLDDIVRDEEISPTVQELLNSYLIEIDTTILSQNAQNLLIAIEERINTSAAINFSYSELKVLREINGEKYIGQKLKERLEIFKKAINPTSRKEYSEFLNFKGIFYF